MRILKLIFSFFFKTNIEEKMYSSSESLNNNMNNRRGRLCLWKVCTWGDVLPRETTKKPPAKFKADLNTPESDNIIYFYLKKTRSLRNRIRI